MRASWSASGPSLHTIRLAVAVAATVVLGLAGWSRYASATAEPEILRHDSSRDGIIVLAPAPEGRLAAPPGVESSLAPPGVEFEVTLFVTEPSPTPGHLDVVVDVRWAEGIRPSPLVIAFTGSAALDDCDTQAPGGRLVFCPGDEAHRRSDLAASVSVLVVPADDASPDPAGVVHTFASTSGRLIAGSWYRSEAGRTAVAAPPIGKVPEDPPVLCEDPEAGLGTCASFGGAAGAVRDWLPVPATVDLALEPIRLTADTHVEAVSPDVLASSPFLAWSTHVELSDTIDTEGGPVEAPPFLEATASATGIEASAQLASIAGERTNDRDLFVAGILGGLAGGFLTIALETTLEVALDRRRRRRQAAVDAAARDRDTDAR